MLERKGENHKYAVVTLITVVEMLRAPRKQLKNISRLSWPWK